MAHFRSGLATGRTFNLNTILQVKTRVFQPGQQGHPDQVPYIVTWESLSRDPPPWVKPFVLPAGAGNPVPAPWPSTTPLTPRAAATPTAPLLDPLSSLFPMQERPKRKSRTQTPPILSDNQSDLLLFDPPPPYPQPLLPQAEAAPLAPVPEEPAEPDIDPDRPPSPDTTDTAEGGPNSQPASRLRLRRGTSARERWPSQALPLRSVAAQFQYWPFSASDLYNWKFHNPSFSQDPQALTALIESVLITHQPIWDDCQQLLQILFTTEEKQLIFLEARKNVPGADRSPTQLLCPSPIGTSVLQLVGSNFASIIRFYWWV